MHKTLTKDMIDRVISHPKQVYTFIGFITTAFSIVPYSYYSIEKNKLEDNQRQREFQTKENALQREENKLQREENEKQRIHEIKKSRW
jgi:hypothetical protein